MAMDPYSVLGVSRDATADEVKKAYRKKARENHPDLNPGDEGAAERMNQINEAYDRIINPEKYAASDARAAAAKGGARGPYAGGYSSGGTGSAQGGQGWSYDGPFGWTSTGWGFDMDDIFGFGGYGTCNIHPEPEISDSSELRAAIAAMNSGRYAQAVNMLNAIGSAYRTARWYYLSSIANKGAGNTVVACDHARRAAKMEPNNQSYQAAAAKFASATQGYTQTQQQGGFRVGVIDPTALCCGCCAIQTFIPMCLRMGCMGI